MAREIKFRAWDDNLSAWHYFRAGEQSPTTKWMGEFTGLKDAKGREIYEGDVLRPIDSQISRLQVKFEDGAFVREWLNVDDGGVFSNPLSQSLDLFEVLGNIYENPELIQKEV